eukprot:gnl/MRDRNA2_/MRDRNA2_100556_c0_seq1.p1 gnl/MRDRNA2_/MRDRNA2_100556_c0~~gnl/MRDRNA2_/MRDRNA2_100556_c0_seq1.p1  ORF type:complete len:462 (+),score=145.78 gnl/MRDRNA2_/MRDRNA2_100556_c0_seq1:89-1474(+)
MSGRSRSRSRGKDGGDPGPSSAETDVVEVALKQLPGEIYQRLMKLFEEGLLKKGDLDLRSVTVFASLNEGLQGRVMNHLEGERIYVANARSKSGFLIAACDKAKTGCLDARGLGAIDPWRSALVAMATPKIEQVELVPEKEWLDTNGSDPVKITVNVSICEAEVGMPMVTMELPLTETSAAVKCKLTAMGITSIPVHKMKLLNENVGFLKDRFTLAYYNLMGGAALELQKRGRGGAKLRKDHTVAPKKPKTYLKSKESSPLDALKALVAGGKAGMPGKAGAPDPKALAAAMMKAGAPPDPKALAAAMMKAGAPPDPKALAAAMMKAGAPPDPKALAAAMMKAGGPPDPKALAMAMMKGGGVPPDPKALAEAMMKAGGPGAPALPNPKDLAAAMMKTGGAPPDPAALAKAMMAGGGLAGLPKMPGMPGLPPPGLKAPPPSGDLVGLSKASGMTGKAPTAAPP